MGALARVRGYWYGIERANAGAHRFGLRWSTPEEKLHRLMVATMIEPPRTLRRSRAIVGCPASPAGLVGTRPRLPEGKTYLEIQRHMDGFARGPAIRCGMKH